MQIFIVTRRAIECFYIRSLVSLIRRVHGSSWVGFDQTLPEPINLMRVGVGSIYFLSGLDQTNWTKNGLVRVGPSDNVIIKNVKLQKK